MTDSEHIRLLKEEIAKLKHELKQDEYKFIRNHNDYYKELCGMREQIDQLQAELDQVLGDAVGFAGIVKSTRVWAADVEQAIQFLTNPLVQTWRARQGKEAG